jgi:prepilin-type N-terminal cleavage/methylation domain-containing protein
VCTSKHSGFSLVEILLALTIGAAVIAAVLQAAFYLLFLEKRILSGALAWERGQNVLSILEPRVLHAGLGLTYERARDVFERSFGKNGKDEAGAPPPAYWTRGPLQIWANYPSPNGLAAEDNGVYRGKGIAVLYAVPSALKAQLTGIADMSPGDSATIQLVPSENLTAITERLPPTAAKKDLRSWVTFPLTQLPVRVTGYSYGSLTIYLPKGSDLSAIYPYDEMHYLRAELFQAQGNSLVSHELTSYWESAEERLEGVLEMWFEWTPSKRLLEAWILTTGGESSSGCSVRPGDWPKEAPWRSGFERHDLAVARGSWILRNM